MTTWQVRVMLNEGDVRLIEATDNWFDREGPLVKVEGGQDIAGEPAAVIVALCRQMQERSDVPVGSPR